jgi:hypothetical protein
MTAYTSSVQVDDLQVHAVEAAISHYLVHVEAVLANGEIAADECHLVVQQHDLRRVLDKLHH